MAELPAHSPLGGSAAQRFIDCPGSVTLAQGIEDLSDDEFRGPGTAAHSVAEGCLSTTQDAWEYAGMKLGSTIADAEMTNAVQIYLNAVREAHPERDQGNFWVERRFHCPSIHKYFYGTADAVYLEATVGARHYGCTLHVWDYKHGAGIVVEAKDNAQCMYYACGALEDLMLWDAVDEVVLHIAQPRAYHADGPLREWRISKDDLAAWLEETLVPAMDQAMVSRDTKSGEHCRFCPVRFRACPSLVDDMEELENLMDEFENATPARQFTGPEIGRLLELHDRSKIVSKAANTLAFHNLTADAKSVPGRKLVKAKSNRVWKSGAEDALKEKLGKQAYTPPTLLSPAKVDDLPGGTALTSRWALKPDKGLTVAAVKDQRGVVDKSTKKLFKPVEGRK